MTHYDTALTILGQTYYASLLIGDVTMQFSASLQSDIAIISMIYKNKKRYDGGILEIYDYDLQTQQILSPASFVGKIMVTEIYDTTVTLRAYSTKRLLNRMITRTYNKSCSAEWGDNRCKMNKDLYKKQIQITNITDNTVTYTVLSGTVINFYNPYLVDSLGNKINIFNHDAILKKFKTESLYDMAIGQTYNLYAGCQKNISNCHNYNNIKNYLGFDKI
jgi:uncharacterized phage protein (TIGR02218 family)